MPTSIIPSFLGPSLKVRIFIQVRVLGAGGGRSRGVESTLEESSHEEDPGK